MSGRRTVALSIERGCVPFLESDIAVGVLTRAFAASGATANAPEAIFAQSYFDATALLGPCRAEKRDALSVMGLRGAAADAESRSSGARGRRACWHLLVPRSPLAPCAGGLPTTEAGPSSDQPQGRVTLTVDKWAEVVSVSGADVAAPLCELSAITDLADLPPRRRAVLTARNHRWMQASLDAAAAASPDFRARIAFPLGTHLLDDTKRGGAGVGGGAGVAAGDNAAPAAPIGVTVDCGLYASWSLLVARRAESASATTTTATSLSTPVERLVLLLNLAAGETAAQRAAYLDELAAALARAEAAAAKAAAAAAQSAPVTLPPLRLVVATVTGRAIVEEVEAAFGAIAPDLVLIAATTPDTFASRGLALQLPRAADTAGGGAHGGAGIAEQAGAPEGGAAIDRRRADRDSDRHVASGLLHRPDATSTASATALVAATLGRDAALSVINLWDPAFKFSRLPLATAVPTTRDADSATSSDAATPAGVVACPCFACERHTAGYVHHLLDVHEMNERILLATHNWVTWIRFLMA